MMLAVPIAEEPVTSLGAPQPHGQWHESETPTGGCSPLQAVFRSAGCLGMVMPVGSKNSINLLNLS